jgi:hypothetical protein
MLAEMKTTDALVPGLDYLGHRLRTGKFMAPPEVGGSRLKMGRKSKLTGSGEPAAKSKSLIASLLRKKA